MTRHDLLNSFAQGHDTLKQILEQTPEGAMDFRPAAGTWTIREIIHHMPDSEASKLKYRSRDITHALELFRLMRLYTVELLQTVEDSVWTDNYIMHPENGKMTLERWLELYAIHADKHAAQIKRNVEAWERAGRP
jgi:hypothetical protein